MMINAPCKISIAKDFSDSTGGRVPDEGPYSGQEFRNNKLLPAIQAGCEKIFIDLDGTDGYGSSFLDESFGGLVKLGFSADFLLNLFVFKSDEDPSYIEELTKYIVDEQNRKK